MPNQNASEITAIHNFDPAVSMRAYITSTQSGDGKWLGLPTTVEKAEALLKEIGARRGYDITSAVIVPDIPVPGATILDELNYLAILLCELGEDDYGRHIFDAAVEAGKHCGSVAELINLTKNFNCFDVFPAFGEAEYGEYRIELAPETYAGSYTKLRDSADPADHALADHIEMLEDNVDFERYGRAKAEQDKGVFTDAGYLIEYEGFTEVYQGPEDIPPEYQVSSALDLSLLKVETTDLAALVYEMHALSGDFMDDASYNLSVLHRRQSSDFLLLINDNGIYLTEADRVYYRGEAAHAAWIGETSGARAFALHVTSTEEMRICADVVEIDIAKRRADIQRHSIDHYCVEAQLRDGSWKSYTPAEWIELPQTEQAKIQSWMRQYQPDDYAQILLHLRDIRQSDALLGGVMEQDTFLREVNNAFMEKASNRSPEMLRIAPAAANEVLREGKVAVYHLLPDGSQELSPLDALPSREMLWSKHYRECAIKPEHLAGVQQWAEHKVEKIMQSLDKQGALEKPKNQDPER